MNIQQIRQQYPQYNDMSDQELADALHKKYYSDLPKEQVYERIGLKQEGPSIGSRIGNAFVRGAEDIDIGASKMGRNVLRALHLPGGQLSDEQISGVWGQKKGSESLADKLIQGLAQYAPAMVAPEMNLGVGGEALASIPMIGKAAASVAPEMATQALFGATQEENPLMGAAEGAGGTLIGRGIGKAFESLRPSKMLRGNLSPEELMRNKELTQGTETGLGQVLENPTLNRLYENVLPHVLGSGAEKVAQRNAAKIADMGEDIMKSIRGDRLPEDYGIELQNAMKEASKNIEKEKNAKFDVVNDLAEKEGVSTSRSSLQSKAKDILEESESDPHLREFMDKADVKLLKSLASPSKDSSYSLKNTNILRGKIGEHAYEASVKGEKPKASIYTQLKDALQKDIDNAIDSSGNEKIKDAHKEAMDFYRKEYSRFKDPNIMKFTKKGGDPDLLLSHFIKGGKNDRAFILRKIEPILAKSGTEDKNLLASAYLSKAFDENGQLNPVKLSTLYNKLGPKQRKTVFSDKDLHQKIKNYTDLVNKNKESFNLMFNPKTGQRNLTHLSHMGQMMAGGLTHSIPGFLGTLAGTAMLGKGATKLLTSPEFREKLIKKMLETEKKSSNKSGVIGSVGTQMSLEEPAK